MPLQPILMVFNNTSDPGIINNMFLYQMVIIYFVFGICLAFMIGQQQLFRKTGGVMKKYPIKISIITLLCFVMVGLYIHFAHLNSPGNAENGSGHLAPVADAGLMSRNISIDHFFRGEFDLVVYFFECWCVYETCFCQRENPYHPKEMISAAVPDDKRPALHDNLKPEKRYDPIIIQAANQYKVDPAMVKAIIMAESSFNPKAVSKWGARGLMQLMPVTARELGVKDSFNPEHNINGGVKYFSKLMNRFNGDVKLALAAYNAGSRKVLKFRGVPPYKETKNYIKKVIKYYKYYQDQMRDPVDRA